MNVAGASHAGRKKMPWYKKVVRETKRVGHQAEGVVYKGLDVIETAAQKSGLKKIVQKTGGSVYVGAGNTTGIQGGIKPGNYGPAIGIGIDADGTPTGYVNQVPISQVSVPEPSMGDDVLQAVKKQSGSSESISYDPSCFESTFILINTEEPSLNPQQQEPIKSHIEPIPSPETPLTDPHPFIAVFLAAGQGIERARDHVITASISHLVTHPGEAAKEMIIHKIELPLDAVNSARLYIAEKLAEKNIENAMVKAIFLKGTQGTAERNQKRIEGLNYIKSRLATGTAAEKTELLSEIAASIVFSSVMGKVKHSVKEKVTNVVFDRVELINGYDFVESIISQETEGL